MRFAAGKRFRLSEWDCGLFCAEWVRLVRGVDPAALHRGQYSTELGLARLLKRRGGLVGHFDTCLRACGIERTDNLKRGDIIVVETPDGLTGGIFTGSLVMLATRHGLIERRLDLAPIHAAWRV